MWKYISWIDRLIEIGYFQSLMSALDLPSGALTIQAQTTFITQLPNLYNNIIAHIFTWFPLFILVLVKVIMSTPSRMAHQLVIERTRDLTAR